MKSTIALTTAFFTAYASAGSPAPLTTNTRWFYEGCFSAPSGHLLDLLTNQNLTDVTIESCLDACTTQHAALGNGECYCGDALIPTLKANADDVNCTVSCGGNGDEACGGPLNPLTKQPTALSLYDSQPPVPISYSGWEYDGCIAHTSSIVNFTHTATIGDITIERCLGACDIAGKDYTYAGLSGNSCFCGTDDMLPAEPLTFVENQYSVCNFPCLANTAQACGGDYTLFDPAVSFYARQNGPSQASSFDAKATGQLLTRTSSIVSATATTTDKARGAVATATSTGSSTKKTNAAEALRFGGEGLLVGLMGVLAIL